MKEYTIPTYDLGVHDMQHAFDVVFCLDTLEKTHGSTLKATPWQNNTRTTDFYIGVDGIPWALKHIFCASGMHVTVKQVLSMPTHDVWRVTNDIKMHFVGSRLFKIESNFELNKKDTHVFLTGGVKCKATLPLPLNMIAERFMLSQCKREIDTYAKVIAAKFMSKMS